MINKGIITIGDTKIEKHKFHYSQHPININSINIDKIKETFDKVSLGLKNCKCFTFHKGDEKFKLLCIMLPKMSQRPRNFDEAKCLLF